MPLNWSLYEKGTDLEPKVGYVTRVKHNYERACPALFELGVWLDTPSLLLSFFPGVGFSTQLGPPVVVIGQYFNKRRFFANGLATAGQSLGQLTIPLLTSYLFHTYGYVRAHIFRLPPRTVLYIVDLLYQEWVRKSHTVFTGN